MAETADVLNTDFGRAKSSCEVVSMRSRKREVLVVRPGLVGGPGDPSGRSTYWPLRFAERRNPVLVPLAPDGESHVQVIDVRDLAIFILEAGMAGNHGYVNAVGKVHTLGHALLLAAEAAEHGPATQGSRAHAHQMFGYDLTLMERDQVNPWAGPRSLPLVLPPGGRYEGFARRSDARALGMGLQRRSLLQSFEDIVHAHGGAGVDALRSGISATAEAALVNELKMRPPTWGGLEEDW